MTEEMKVGYNQSDIGDEEIFQAVGEVKNVQIRGVIYKVGASALEDIPKLNNNVAKIEKLANGKDDLQLLKDDTAINLMREIMFQGTKDYNPGITKEYISKNFTLSAFPLIFRIMLDLNEYLASMQKLKNDQVSVSDLKKK